MSIAVPGRSLTGIHAEKEDIHPDGPRLRLARSSSFRPPPVEMASNLRRTENLHRIKTREIWLQDVSGTYAPDGSILYVRGDGLVQTRSGVYVSAPGTLLLEGPCASIGNANDTQITLKWIKQQASFNTTAIEGTNVTDAGQPYTKNLRGAACDSQGNTIVAYATDGTVPGGINSGFYDIAVAKFDSLGNLIWVRQTNLFNTPYSDLAPAIAIGPDDNIYVAENYRNFSEFVSERVRYFKIDTTGSVIWSFDLDTATNKNYVTISVYDNSLWIGVTRGQLGTSPEIYRVNTTTGAVTPITNLGKSALEIASAISPTHLFVLTPEINVTDLFEPQRFRVLNLHIDRINLATNAVTPAPSDAPFNPVTWSVPGGTTQGVAAPAITVGPDNNPVISYFTISHTPTTTYSGSGIDMVVAKLNAGTLTPMWVRQFSTGYTNTANMESIVPPWGSSITSDDSGNIYALYTTLPTPTNIDIKITVLTADGTIYTTFSPPFANTPVTDRVPMITNVKGTTDIVIAYQTEGTVPGGVNTGQTDIVIARYTYTPNSITLQPEGGYVGVGTCAPQYTLDVSGTIAAHDANGVFGLFSSGTETILAANTSVGPISVPGLTPSGRVLATFNGAPYNATTLWATLGGGEFTLYVDQNPSDGDVKIAWLVLKL